MNANLDFSEILDSVPPEIPPQAVLPFRAWCAGFDAHDAGAPFSHGTMAGRLCKQWQEGWLASATMDNLLKEVA
jgi:hypothetical protein